MFLGIKATRKNLNILARSDMSKFAGANADLYPFCKQAVVLQLFVPQRPEISNPAKGGQAEKQLFAGMNIQVKTDRIGLQLAFVF
jgi:hypothetical protein